MVCTYNLNTSSNRPVNHFKHPIPTANHWIPFSHRFAGAINPPDTKIKQNRIYRKVCVVRRIERLFSDALWIVDK